MQRGVYNRTPEIKQAIKDGAVNRKRPTKIRTEEAKSFELNINGEIQRIKEKLEIIENSKKLMLIEEGEYRTRLIYLEILKKLSND